MLNLMLLAAALSFGTPAAEPACLEMDSPMDVAAVCTEPATTVAPAACPADPEALVSFASEGSEPSAGVVVLQGVETLGLRYCCPTQQSIACAAQGGTTTCRTGVCQCQF